MGNMTPGRLIEFRLPNDERKPTVFRWKIAPAKAWDEHVRSMRLPNGVLSEDALPADQQEARKQRLADWIFDRVVSVEAFDVDGPDGQPRSLRWPEDRAEIVAAFKEWTGPYDAFMTTVIRAHKADRTDHLAAAFGGVAGN